MCHHELTEMPESRSGPLNRREYGALSEVLISAFTRHHGRAPSRRERRELDRAALRLEAGQ